MRRMVFAALSATLFGLSGVSEAQSGAPGAQASVHHGSAKAKYEFRKLHPVRRQEQLMAHVPASSSIASCR